MKAINLFIVMMVLALVTVSRLYGQEEFREWNDQETAKQDEFKDYADSSRYIQKDSAEVSSLNGVEADPGIAPGTGSTIKKNQLNSDHKHSAGNLYWVLGVMVSTVAAGILSRSVKGRKLRLFFLVGSISIIGFYHSACPCPISGFQELLLFGIGGQLHPVKVLWFVLLLPVTYVFGRVWCGWICHLGALQELLNFNGKFNFLSSPRAQSVMRYLRISILVILIIQLVITRTILWEEIDPFKAIFNLFASHTFTWILVALLLISSVLVYRPFCKSVCPVGLVLGWISRIPGASIIAATPQCVGCKLCTNACRSNAITRTGHDVSFDEQQCIACGECIDSCKHKALDFGKNRRMDKPDFASE